MVPYGGLLCAIIGLVLGLSAMKDASNVGQTNGLATACIVLSIVGLAGAVIWIVVCSAALAALTAGAVSLSGF